MSKIPGTDGRVVADFDHHSIEYRDRTVDVLRSVRKGCPVSWTEAHGGYWVATGYDAVWEAARDEATFSSLKEVFVEASPFRGATLPDTHPEARQGFSEMDGEMHRAGRNPLSPYFTPKAAADMRPEIESSADWCIDQFIERGSADLINELASPVPAIWALRMLGLPLEDWRRYADVAHKIFYLVPGTEEHKACSEDLAWMNGQIEEALADRRKNPKDDLISVVARTNFDGEPINDNDALGTVQLLLHGGLDTTTNLLAHTFLHLSENPDTRAWLAQDYSRLPAACEEYLRFFAPVQGLARTVTKPCTLAGQRLEANERIWLGWAAANLDPGAFDEPEVIKLDRYPNRHTSFAVGPHRCLGSAFGRMIWEVVLTRVLERLGDFHIERDQAQRYPRIPVMNGWSTMPATFTPGRVVGATLETVK
jgi:cytochrome P450